MWWTWDIPYQPSIHVYIYWQSFRHFHITLLLTRTPNKRLHLCPELHCNHEIPNPCIQAGICLASVEHLRIFALIVQPSIVHPIVMIMESTKKQKNGNKSQDDYERLSRLWMDRYLLSTSSASNLPWEAWCFAMEVYCGTRDLPLHEVWRPNSMQIKSTSYLLCSRRLQTFRSCSSPISFVWWLWQETKSASDMFQFTYNTAAIARLPASNSPSKQSLRIGTLACKTCAATRQVGGLPMVKLTWSDHQDMARHDDRSLTKVTSWAMVKCACSRKRGARRSPRHHGWGIHHDSIDSKIKSTINDFINNHYQNG